MIDELKQELFRGAERGRREAIEEAPYLEKVAKLKDPNYSALHGMRLQYAEMPEHVLGVTKIDGKGDVHNVAINSKIPWMIEKARQAYKKSREWAYDMAYNIGFITADHEYTHVFTSKVARGENINQSAVDVMESLPGYAKIKVAKQLGKNKKARMIEQTTPYPRALKMGQLADWAPYESENGTGYAALMKDLQEKPFYKPLSRLAWQATKAAARKGKGYFKGQGVPSPAAA